MNGIKNEGYIIIQPQSADSSKNGTTSFDCGWKNKAIRYTRAAGGKIQRLSDSLVGDILGLLCLTGSLAILYVMGAVIYG